MRLQALRGAITCTEDSKAEIDAKTAAAGEGALRPQRARPRRRRQHHLHRHPRPHRRVPGERGARRPRPRRRRAARRPGAGRRRTARRAASGCSCTATPTGPATSCTTCSSRVRRRCGPTSPTPTDVRDLHVNRSGVRRADRHRPHRWLDRARAAPRGRRRARLRPRPGAGRGRRGPGRGRRPRRRRRRRGGRAPTSSWSRCRWATSPRSCVEALDAGRGAGHRRRLGEGAGRRRGGGGAPRPRGALRRWSPDGRLGAGGPRRRRAPTCSSARRGCSRPPGAPTRRSFAEVRVVGGRGSAPRRSRSRPSCTTRWSRW